MNYNKNAEKILTLTSVPGDNGLSLGAAIMIAKENGFKIDKYQNPFWGPEYTNEQIEYVLTRAKLRFEHVKDISKEVAHLVAQGKIIGWFQGRIELGARALGICVNTQTSNLRNLQLNQ